MTDTTVETAPETTDVRANSRTREITATVVTTVVVVALTAVAGKYIDKLGRKVHDQIAPPATTETPES